MGVHGLWKLIDAAGKPVPVETLENRILAVDVSIWLHQLVKGFQDSTGGTGANAHLLGLFYRICKLLFFRIKPIFVFDGGVPALKRKTIAARQSNRSKASESIEKIRQELLQNLLKQHALGKILGQNVKIPKSVLGKQDSMFFLPPVPSTSTNEEASESVADWEKSSSSEEESESSADELSPRKKYGDIHSIDVKSKEFKALPADIRHDILSELKETRKQNSWAKVHLMPEEVGDFSSFQMERLLKRRSVQVGLEDAEKEMGPRCFTVSEIQEILEYQGLDVSQKSQRIASDSTTRFLYSTQLNMGKNKSSKLSSIAEVGEELDSEVDDPFIDALKANEDMPQEEILALIKEEETKKKARELMLDCGKSTENANEPSTDEIRDTKRANLDPGKTQPESTTLNLKKQKTFDSKLVTKLLRDSAKKNLIPISKVDKILDRKKKKSQKKKIIRKVSAHGPNLSESDSSDSDIPVAVSQHQISSSESSQEMDDLSVIPHKEPLIESKKCESNIKNISISPSVSEKNVSPVFLSDNSSLSNDDDFEEVSNEPVIDSCREDSSSLSNSAINNEKIKNSHSNQKCISLDLNFEKPLSDDDDIFADIFETPKEQSNEKSHNIPQAVTITNVSEQKQKHIELNCKKSVVDDEEIVDDAFDVSKTVKFDISCKESEKGNFDQQRLDKEDILEGSKKSQSELVENVENPYISKKELDTNKIDSFVNSKEADRAVILEELLITKNKLEKELKSSETIDSVKIDNPTPSDDDFEEVEDVKCSETQESLEEKKYFNNDELALECERSGEKSPNSFAKKLSTVEQVRQFQSTLERESSSLIREKRRDEKIAATLSEQLTVEAQEMLNLFGIPYVVAPMEAEAQCAFLDINGLTQGTITDDSDIWLFGASNVYKNFFDQKKFVKLFKSSDIQRVYNLGRNELIMVGLLVGSDYTSGLNGVGPVTALEIVADFPPDGEDTFPSRDRLARFASAFNEHRLSRKLTKQLLPVQLIEGFPSLEVVRAYTDPQVDESLETFTWGIPSLERIREYAMDKFGWDAKKTDQTLEPVFDKLSQKNTQTTLHGFFDWAFEDVQGKMSKRVETAVNLLGMSPTKRSQEIEESSSQESASEKAKQILVDKHRVKKRKSNAIKSLEEGPSSAFIQTDSDEDLSTEAASVPDNISIAGPSTMDPYTPNIPSVPKSKKQEVKPSIIPPVRRVNATLEKLRKGKSLSDKPRVRRSRETVSLTKPIRELDFDGPFGSGETRKRKKIHRTDEEKWREIEEARAKAARVLAKLKNVEQFHANPG